MNATTAKPEIWRKDFDITGMDRCSGMCLSSDGSLLFTISDCPGLYAYVYVYDRVTMKRTVIEIVGLRRNQFKAWRGLGYGSWGSIKIGSHPQDSNMKCLIIGDIGNSTGQHGAYQLRNASQQTRLIIFKEPTREDILASTGDYLTKGEEYQFMYSNANLTLDAQSLCVVEDFILIVTTNKRDGDKKSYVYMCPIQSLQSDQVTTFMCIGEMTIGYSEVTDAFCTTKCLALRTLQNINLYALSDLVPGVDAPLKGFINLSDISKFGAQKAITYEKKKQRMYLLGQGSNVIFTLKFDVSDYCKNWTDTFKTMASSPEPEKKTAEKKKKEAVVVKDPKKEKKEKKETEEKDVKKKEEKKIEVKTEEKKKKETSSTPVSSPQSSKKEKKVEAPMSPDSPKKEKKVETTSPQSSKKEKKIEAPTLPQSSKKEKKVEAPSLPIKSKEKDNESDSTDKKKKEAKKKEEKKTVAATRDPTPRKVPSSSKKNP